MSHSSASRFSLADFGVKSAIFSAVALVRAAARKHGAGPARTRNGRVANELCHSMGRRVCWPTAQRKASFVTLGDLANQPPTAAQNHDRARCTPFKGTSPMTSAPDVANRLYFGDNLDILRQYVPDETVDLIYLDPPFNSNATYNVLFRERSGEESVAQITAFEDTWHWGWESEIAFQDVVTRGPDKVGSLLAALRQFLGQNDMMAYLTMMAQRMTELHRVLKPTGSIYLHCDPTASHYLKLLMDAVFDARNFRNEIVWLRTMAKGLMSRQLPNNHDVILGYKKTGESTWNVDATFQPYDEFSLDAKTAAKYSHRDPDGRLYQLDNLLNPNRNRPNLTYEFLGITRVWRWTKPQSTDKMRLAAC